MADGSGSIRIVKTSDFKDGSFAAISTTRESGADQNIVHSLAVRIDARSLDNALADGSFHGCSANKWVLCYRSNYA